MSLDVYLHLLNLQETEDTPKKEHSGIFIRRDGQTVEISWEEWNELYPDRAPVVVHSSRERSDIAYSANITHNLAKMATAAGLYETLWQPEDAGYRTAHDLIPVLSDGLVRLCTDPVAYRRYNPENGWGSYETLVRFVTEYLQACAQYPEAIVRVCR